MIRKISNIGSFWINVRAILTFGFLLVGLSTIFANQMPANGYEPSIYHDTPILVWAGIFAGAVIGILGLLIFHHYKTSFAVLLLSSLMAVIFIPLFRGYFYLGTGDSLNHLGWAMDLSMGVTRPTNILYPGLHLIGVIFERVLDMSLHKTLVFAAIIFPLLHVIFIPLSVRRISNHKTSYILGIISGSFLLSINTVRFPLIEPVPINLATFFVPLCLFLFVVISQDSAIEFKLIFLISSLALVFFHSQVAFALILVTGAIYVYGKYVPNDPQNQQYRDSAFFVTVNLLIILLFWLSTQASFAKQPIRLIMLLLGFNPRASIVGATEVANLTGSNLYILILKTFLVHLIFLSILGIFLVRIFLNELSHKLNDMNIEHGNPHFLKYLAIGSLPVTLVVLTFFLSGSKDQSFRFSGLLMVLASVLVPAIIVESRFLESSVYRPRLKKSIKTVAVLFLILSLITIFPSLYVSKPTGHITQAQVDGYETVFEISHDRHKFIRIYSPLTRYRAVTYGRNANEYGVGIKPKNEIFVKSGLPGIPPHFADRNLARYRLEPVYLIITEDDRFRTIELQNGRLFSRSDYRYLMHDQAISKVYDNGGTDVYLVN